MYHCHIRFCLAGHSCRAYEIIKGMSPLEHFTHEFTESRDFKGAFASGADVIVLHVQGREDRKELETLAVGRTDRTELILLSEDDVFSSLKEFLPTVGDVWRLPMSEDEVRFRFLRWQQNYKTGTDLWETGQYLEATIDHVPNLIWYKDKDGIHEKVNQSFCRTVNKTRDQVQGRGHAYIWDVEEDDPACIESEREVMTRKETIVSEEVIKTGEGMRQLTTYKSPLYDLDGSVMGTVGVAIDVTRERAYEEELVEKNRTLEKILTTVDCGIMYHTVDGSNVIRVNRAALQILGYESLEEMMADGFNMVAASVMDEDKEKLRRCIRELKKTGDSASVEYRVNHRDGGIRHVMGNIKLLEENGEPLYQRFLLDCTEQKLQEKEKERRQREMIQALGIDYCIVYYFDLNTGKGMLLRSDGTGGIPGSDAETEEELSLEDCMESYIEQVVCEEDRDMLRQAVSRECLREKLKAEKKHHVNYRIRKNGNVEYFQVKAVRAGELGQNHGVVLGFRSVDEEIRNEMEQKSMLEDALSQANRANRAKSTFLSNMSHDIRTPMNAIVGFTSLAISHIDHKEQVETYLGKIMTSGNHLLSLINDVLDMSRIESGKMHLEEKLCRLPEILQGLRSIVQADIHAKQLELYMDTVDVVDEEIYCDKLRLNQVLLNLLSNAIKYTGAGGTINVRITEKSEAPEGFANYEFSIRDTGIGMSREFVEHIFEPFEREKNTTISGIQGTGLGMAITKNIVDMMGGSIHVESEQGKGSEFTLSITFRLNTERKEIQEIPELKNVRALVVDDDFNTCDSVSYMLGQIGLRGEWTLSGKEAVLRTRQAAMREDSYSVYIIDWLLPDMNGVEVTRRIRREMGEKVPVIILTAYDWSDIEEEAKEAGVTAFCSKPLFLSELRNCLNSIIGKEKEEAEEKHRKPVTFHTGRILLAEDNELNQEIAIELLKDAGFQTEIARNGQEAVDMLEEAGPGYYQVILMDIQMPVMNGYDAARKIRSLEDPALSSIPILAMTANAFEEDKQESLRCGMNGHISKPIDVENLFNTLETALKL